LIYIKSRDIKRPQY